MSTPKNASLHVRVNDEIKHKLEELAKAEGRTVSGWIIWQIEKAHLGLDSGKKAKPAKNR